MTCPGPAPAILTAVLVSEIMLQQTQVDRVIPKYRQFLRRFPSLRALARAPVEMEWVEPARLADYDFPPADHELIERLRLSGKRPA